MQSLPIQQGFVLVTFHTFDYFRRNFPHPLLSPLKQIHDKSNRHIRGTSSLSIHSHFLVLRIASHISLLKTHAFLFGNLLNLFVSRPLPAIHPSAIILLKNLPSRINIKVPSSTSLSIVPLSLIRFITFIPLGLPAHGIEILHSLASKTHKAESYNTEGATMPSKIPSLV